MREFEQHPFALAHSRLIVLNVKTGLPTSVAWRPITGRTDKNLKGSPGVISAPSDCPFHER